MTTVADLAAAVDEHAQDAEWFIGNVRTSQTRTEMADNLAAAYRISQSVIRVQGSDAGDAYRARIEAARLARFIELTAGEFERVVAAAQRAWAQAHP